MDALRRLLGLDGGVAEPAQEPPAPEPPHERVTMTSGRPTVLGRGWRLEVVGESYRQDAIRSAAESSAISLGGRTPVQAVLRPEPDNPHDQNAIAVMVGRWHVGYIGREDAAILRPGLWRLMEQRSAPIALEGVITGQPTLGVFLSFDPAEFGLDRELFSKEPGRSVTEAESKAP